MAQRMMAILTTLSICSLSNAQFFKTDLPSGTVITSQFAALFPQFSNLPLQKVTLIDGAEGSYRLPNNNPPLLFDRLSERHLLADFSFGQMRF